MKNNKTFLERLIESENFVDLGRTGTPYPYSYNSFMINLEKSLSKVKSLEALYLFTEICYCLEQNYNCYRYSMSVNLSHNKFKDKFPDKALFRKYKKELSDLKMIIPDKSLYSNSPVYFVNPNIFNILYSEQRKLCSANMGYLFSFKSDVFIP